MNKDQKLLAEVYSKIFLVEQPNIERLAQQDSREIYGNETYPPDKEPSKIIDDPKFKGSIEERDEKEFLAAKLAEDIKNVLDNTEDADTIVFAKAVAQVFNDQYSNKFTRKSFMNLLKTLIR